MIDVLWMSQLLGGTRVQKAMIEEEVKERGPDR